MSITHQLGEHPQTPATEACIDLGLGHPSPSLLPAVAFAQMASETLPEDPLVLQYGTIQGTASFRSALARFLGQHGITASADDLMVSGGTSMALALVSQVLARRGSRVVCSDPTYFLARRIFEANGLEVVGIPVEDGVLQVDRLEPVTITDAADNRRSASSPRFRL